MFQDPLIGIAIAAVLTFIAIAGIGYVADEVRTGVPSQKRTKSVTARAGIRSRRQAGAIDQNNLKKKQLQETLQSLEEEQRTARKRRAKLKTKIEQAGLKIDPRAFHAISAGFGLAVAIGVIAFGGMSPLVGLAAGFGAGVGLPRWGLQFIRNGRLKKFGSEFANAIDVIVRGVKSGLPLNECLKVIAAESPEPLKSEFTTLIDNIAMGMSIDDGLKRMYDRIPLQEVSFFGTVLSIQQKTGGNLAEALGNLSGVLRARKMMREKIAALSGEAKASALIIGSLPPGVMTIVAVTTPDYMGLMFTHPKGQMMLLGGGLWMATGIFVMKKMISFKI
jgi:tight adherence protein B